MTNPQKKQLLETWINLKPKLSKLVYLYQNKELIKRALTTHLNIGSSYSSFSSVVRECRELLKKLEE